MPFEFSLCVVRCVQRLQCVINKKHVPNMTSERQEKLEMKTLISVLVVAGLVLGCESSKVSAEDASVSSMPSASASASVSVEDVAPEVVASEVATVTSASTSPVDAGAPAVDAAKKDASSKK